MEKINSKKSKTILFRVSGGLTGVLGLLMVFLTAVPSNYWSMKILGLVVVVNSYFAIRSRKVSIFFMLLIGVYLFSYLLRGPYNVGDVPYYIWGRVALGGGSLFILAGCIQAIVAWKNLKWF